MNHDVHYNFELSEIHDLYRYIDEPQRVHYPDGSKQQPNYQEITRMPQPILQDDSMNHSSFNLPGDNVQINEENLN